MKVGILTQPLEENYGGILQAYALQQTLLDIGVHSTIINRVDSSLRYLQPIERFRNIVGKLLRIREPKDLKYVLRRYQVDQKVRDQIYKHTYRFIDSYLHTSPRLRGDSEFIEYINSLHVDGYVVGSDQCWRPKYSPNIYDYFLDFCFETEGIKRIAYAASFGVDEWEFTPEQTKQCSELIQKFDAVSVRESSGITLCSEYLNYRHAVHLLDPTMLLDPEAYIRALSLTKAEISKGNLFSYILDNTPEKEQILNQVVHTLQLTPFSVKAKHLYEDTTNYSIKECTQPPVEQWLRGFMDAQFVVTDSFHGCVFSILFNKPFIDIGNKERGLARFYSLLQMFGLEERLLTTHQPATITNLLAQPIDWVKVNGIRSAMRDQSIQFLSDNLVTP